MGAVVFTKCKAVRLFFASLFVSVAGSYGWVDKFTTKPEDKEVFVGGSVQFDWDYAVTDVRQVRFGLVVDPGGQDIGVAIYIKVRDGTLRFNNMSESVKWIRKRVEVVPNRRASFKINSVQMDDSKTFFCLLVGDRLTYGGRDDVKLTVLDLLIDDKESTQFVESWQGHNITVVCAVKLPAGERLNVKFSWMHIPSNRTVAKRNHNDERSQSSLTITTYKDEDFEELQCRAETNNTVKYHVINITRLNLPTQPRNLKAWRLFDRVNGLLLIRLSWEPPQSNGGATIEKYIVSYRPNELPWKQSTHLDTEDSLFYDLRLQSGTTYHARVRAKNKAGISPVSNEVEVNLGNFPSSEQNKLLQCAVCLMDVTLDDESAHPLGCHCTYLASCLGEWLKTAGNGFIKCPVCHLQFKQIQTVPLVSRSPGYSQQCATRVSRETSMSVAPRGGDSAFSRCSDESTLNHYQPADENDQGSSDAGGNDQDTVHDSGSMQTPAGTSSGSDEGSEFESGSGPDFGGDNSKDPPSPDYGRTDSVVTNATERTLRIRREQVLQDMIQAFSFDEIMTCSIKVVMVDARGNDEMGEDEKGIYRDAIACFWHQFYLTCTMGERKRVPTLRHDFQCEEWTSIGRIIAKGKLDLGYFLIMLSPALIISVLFGEKEVWEETLLNSFYRYLPPGDEVLCVKRLKLAKVKVLLMMKISLIYLTVMPAESGPPRKM
ncbi:uncharacterized protein [Acropora muricata]|uniref:uncharacterized protein n=1 Tax=Acropora muricata TaxID=159855 RepID=UPI0034E43642